VTSIAEDLATWAVDFKPTTQDVELAQRSLLDTIAVTIAARNEPIARVVSDLSEATRWAVLGHVLDFDDLHMESTAHISVVCVSAALATGGDARSYLAGAGVMARLGIALGWSHYSSGWHTTATAGAPAAAVAASIALGLNADQIATAMALAVPAAGGVQRAFGTDAKSLQVGFAANAGVRAARLAAAGATADPSAVDVWLELVGGDPSAIDTGGPAIPGGLALKAFPCCYALQRPINALSGLARQNHLNPDDITRIVLKTPKGTVTPLIHHRPTTGLQAKFSIEYAAATAMLDEYQGFSSFTDESAQRPEVRRLVDLVDVQLGNGGDWLLAGEFEAEVYVGEKVLHTQEQFPPGSPQRPLTKDQLMRKVQDCLTGTSLDPETIDWSTANKILRHYLLIPSTP
jgi:2-methylcitrate dehydratase PrpD